MPMPQSRGFAGPARPGASPALAPFGPREPEPPIAMKQMIKSALARAGLELTRTPRGEGARQAVDEYFAARAEPVYLHRVDCTARLVIKQEGA